jgi:hypothetical protein
MNNALRNSFVVEPGQFLTKVKVLDESGTANPTLEGIIRMRYGDPLIRG